LSCQRKFFSFGARCPNPLLLPLSSAAHERERERERERELRETERHCSHERGRKSVVERHGDRHWILRGTELIRDRESSETVVRS
jgi:hypothetical protein